ncbi:MAG TPA: hypothetical protein PLI11_07670 [Clostridia bacterium]|nr:hypothetical protein [Clostridia bacterium]
MIFKPRTGCMWDPTVMYINSKYYMFSMYKEKHTDLDNNMYMAVSEDGVHWEDVGAVLEDTNGVCKMFVYETDEYVMVNFGSFSEESRANNDTLRFYRSKDLKEWEYVGKATPDTRWYKGEGRYDHMYVIKEGDTYYGYPVATPKPEYKSCFGILTSKDGVNWTSHKPPVIEWGDIPPINCLEGGGVEKINGKYYYIGGFVGYAGNYGYGLYTFIGDSPMGPFKPDKEAFRLCGFDRLEGRVFVQNLACFARGDGQLLISNAVDAGGPYEIWLLPLRKAHVDEDGHLRLAYWEQNDLLKGIEIKLDSDAFNLSFNTTKLYPSWRDKIFVPSNDGFHACVEGSDDPVVNDRKMLVTIDRKLDLEKGFILEGKFAANSYPHYDEVNNKTQCWRPATFGVFMGEEDDKGMGIELEIGHPYKRKSYVTNVSISNNIMKNEIIDTIDEGCANVKGVDANTTHTFKLLYRRNVYELYVNDLHVQTFVHLGKPNGTMGFILQNSDVTVSDIKLYEMSL